MEKAVLTIPVRGNDSTIEVRQDTPKAFRNGFSYEGYYNMTFARFLRCELETWKLNSKKITVNFLDFYNRETLAIFPLYEEQDHE